MAAVKNFNTNLVIQSTAISSNITLDAETLTVNTVDAYITGNLHVAGVYDTTTVTNTNVEDRDIVLNVGETNWGVGGNGSPGTSGIYVDRGYAANVGIRWNETVDKWQATEDGSAWQYILQSNVGGTGLTAIIEDTHPQLGANLATNGFYVTFQTSLTTPSATSGNTHVYASAVGSAGSGLYVVNSGTASDELVTKAKAIVFSLIL